MHKGKYVFALLLDFLDRNDFNFLARKYGGDKYVKQFTCYNQLCVLMFDQLSNRESLRDVVHVMCDIRITAGNSGSCTKTYA